MLPIFLNKPTGLSYPIKQWTKWDYIKRVLLREIDKITNYYHHRSRHVWNNHILSRIVKFLSPDIYLSNFEYFKIVDSTTEYTARQFDFVTNSWKGKVLENIFYKNEYVIFNYSKTDFDISTLHNNWMYATPIKMIYTTETVLDYYQYDKTKYTPHTTITIVEIDLTLMLMMYRYWALNQVKQEASTNANYFIAQIILPNMVKNNIDIILFNRLYELFYRNKVTSSTSEDMYMNIHPFHVIDLHRVIDNIYLDVINKVKGNSISLEQLLSTIPTLYYKSMLDALYINRPFYTRQSEWVLWVSRAKYITFLLDILGSKGIARNTFELNRLPALIKMLKNRSTDLQSQLPYDLWAETNEYIEKISFILGRR